MAGTYIYRQHIGKRTINLVRSFWSALGLSLIVGLIFMIYTGGEMSLDYRSFSDEQAMNSAVIVGSSVFLI